MMAAYEQKTIRLDCQGICLARPVDSMPPGKFPILRNVRVRQAGAIEPRAGIQQVNAIAMPELNVHSIRRLNDPLPGATVPWARVIGAGTKLYTGQGALTEQDAGYSGDPLSLVPFRPERSPQAWMYVADRNRLRKIRADGTDYAIGIVPSREAPAAALDALTYQVVNDFDAVAGWANGGTAGAIAAVARVNTTIASIRYDSGAAGWASIEPTAMDESIQPGVLVVLDAGGASQEGVFIQEINPAITATTIGSIVYDVGAVGDCTIQPVLSGAGLRSGSMLLIGAGPTQEVVTVVSVTPGPDDSYSFRCTTVNTQGGGGAIAGLRSFRAYCANLHIALETITTNCLQTTVAAGTGYMTLVAALDLSAIAGRGAREEDEMHISLRIDNPGNIVEGKVLLDCDSGTNDFSQNYFFRAFRASDLTPATRDTLTVSTTRERALQREITDEAVITYEEEQPGGGTLTRVVHVPEGQSVLEALLAAREGTPEYVEGSEALPASEQTETGGVQWTELRFRLKDLTRVGTDNTRGLRNIAAIRVQLTVLAATQFSADGWWVGGTYGPDCETNVGAFGFPLFYRYRYRSSQTGAKSLPSPATRAGLTPQRQRVLLTAQVSADPQVDRIDFERIGGSLNQWRYVDSIPNTAPANFQDVYADAEIANNPNLETDAFQPFPVVDARKAGTCNVVGTMVTRVSGDAFSTAWAPGTIVKIDGTPNVLYRVISTNVLELVKNVGTSPGSAWDIEEPLSMGQPLPMLWGPLPDENFLFACGDDRNPGILYATKGNDPDSAPDTHQIEVTTPSEPLMNGCIYDGKCLVASTARWFWVRRSEGANVLERQDLPVGRGLWARWALAVGPKVWFLARDGIYETTGGPAVSITHDDLYPLFPHEGKAGRAVNGYQPPDMNQATALRLAYADGWLFFDYQDVAGQQHTLAYDTRRGAWYGDQYTPDQVCHYEEEAATSGAILSGGDDGRVYNVGGTSDAGTSIACVVRTPAEDGGNPRNRKVWGDYVTDLNPDSATVSVQPWFDNFSASLAAQNVTGAARVLTTIDLNAGLGRLARNMGVEFTWSSASATPQLYTWQPSVIPKVEDTLLRATDWIDLGQPTFLQGIRIEADSAGVDEAVEVQYDGGTVGDTLTLNHNGQIKKSYSFTAPFMAQMIRLVPTTGSAIRIFSAEPIGEPCPDLGYRWKTQPTTHDLSGYQHLRMGYFAHMATADITLRIIADGTTYTYTIPHNAGAYAKTRIDFDPIKAKFLEYDAQSDDPWRLFKRDCEVHVKQWGDQGPYRVVNPFGGAHRADGAKI